MDAKAREGRHDPGGGMLTDRQRQALELMTRGYTNAEIGARLGISLDGAKWLVSEVLTRLDVTSREEAVAWWRDHNRPAVRLRRRMHALLLAPVLAWTGGSTVSIAAGAGAAVAVMAALGTAGYLAGTELRDSSGEAQAEPTPPARPDFPGPDVTPEPGATPDMAVDWWAVPYANADGKLPRYTRVVAGIELGPDVKRPEPPCGIPGTLGYNDAAAAGTGVEIAPAYLPRAAQSDAQRVDDFGLCDGGITSAMRSYWIPRSDEDMARVKRREISFFEAQHGGAIEILRLHLLAPAFATGFPSGRFEPGLIGGHPTAVGPPLFPEGWGDSEIYVWDEKTGVLTIVRGGWISLPDMLLIAEGLFK